ncbi:MAG: sigma-70 family RNA polymerase sigma factor [Fusobacterium gastrosuis]|uniref:sigma-70 family RNA polymerase sigma factor n=1 Tax=Fusobacterium gastrosuis TaxID=1755100 RepID=UPI002A8F2999|nr:sigma-70 family RNA polymerase sigma factor [Fusobacterium gastrosuis]
MENLIEQHKKLIYSINSKYGKTEDGIQEGILGILRAIDTFDESYGVKFSTHAYKHIHRHIKNFFDKERYKTTVHYSRKIKAGDIEYNGQTELLEEIAGTSKEENLETKIFINSLIEKNCNNKEKKFIKMLYYEGKTEAEIARELKISRQAVNQYKNYILQKLRNSLK